jgi:AcrR family transcriptional regulator
LSAPANRLNRCGSDNLGCVPIATIDKYLSTTIHRREPLLTRLRDAFLGVGYEAMTMLALAPLAGVSRRTLYNHFANKEDAFRFMMRCDGDIAIEHAMKLAREKLEAGAKPLDLFVALMDARYAEIRRRLALSKHALEINEKAFRIGRDIQIEHATTFQDEVAVLIGEMQERGVLTLKRGTSAGDLAQMLCDGARGSNQTLPPIPIEKLPDRYRKVLGAILYGALAS